MGTFWKFEAMGLPMDSYEYASNTNMLEDRTTDRILPQLSYVPG